METSRRGFFGALGGAAVGIATASTLPETPTPATPEKPIRIDVVTELDGRELARMVIKHMHHELSLIGSR